MAIPKYRQFFNEMFETNKEKFLRFKILHEDYVRDNEQFKEQFDREGKEILDIISKWEQRLCGKMERGGKGVFSSSLSEKFRGEVRKYFSLIDHIGVTVFYKK